MRLQDVICEAIANGYGIKRILIKVNKACPTARTTKAGVLFWVYKMVKAGELDAEYAKEKFNVGVRKDLCQTNTESKRRRKRTVEETPVKKYRKTNTVEETPVKKYRKTNTVEETPVRKRYRKR
jgi:hypothetical protein